MTQKAILPLNEDADSKTSIGEGKKVEREVVRHKRKRTKVRQRTSDTWDGDIGQLSHG